MDFKQKIVTQMPLSEIWNDEGQVSARRERYLSSDEIRTFLKQGPVKMVVANPGDKLNWIDDEQAFEFWKEEVKPHLADDIDDINLDDYESGYAYIASEWIATSGDLIILLEKYH